MASTRGPLPKRNAARAGHQGKKAQADVVTLNTSVVAPAPRPEWHDSVTDLYLSMAESAASRFYEPSDWQWLRVVLDQLNDYLTSARKSAELFKAICGELDRYGVTEGSRRRMRVEGHRPGHDSPDTDGAREASNAVAAQMARLKASGGKA